MRILFAVNEAAPLYKIGGLGDVGGSLPKALSNLKDVDIRLVLPYHPEIASQKIATTILTTFTIVYDHQPFTVKVHTTQLPSTLVPVYLIEEAHFLSKPSDALDNHADKYAVFSLTIVEWLASHSPNYQPDILHCQDWHTSLIPVLLKHRYPQIKAKTLITIHNLEYQGITNTPVAAKLHLDPSQCHYIKDDLADNNLNILLEGLVHTDYISTVSPTYAQEITHLNRNDQVAQVLAARSQRLWGIINGLDTASFDPQTDPNLYATFSPDTANANKQVNKQHLLQELKLELVDSPLISYIGRVDPGQKGIDLIIQALNSRLLPPSDTSFIFLGTGDPNLESQLHQAANGINTVRVITRFDEALARKIYAASDLLLVPSYYEPCGLIQLIAMRYGTLPVAHATGGLKDTIKPAETGWLYTPNTLEGMMGSLNTALNFIRNPVGLHDLRLQAMSQDFSWDKPAQQYLKLYRHIVNS